MSEQLIGYINMAVGLVGIVVSILTAPSIASLARLPSGEAGTAAVLAQAVKLTGVLLVILTFMFVLALGMVLTLVPLTTSMGAAHPVLTTVMTVCALFALAASGAMLLAQTPWCVPGILASAELAILAIIAGLVDEKALFIFTGMAFLGLLLIAVIGTGASTDEPPKPGTTG